MVNNNNGLIITTVLKLAESYLMIIQHNFRAMDSKPSRQRLNSLVHWYQVEPAQLSLASLHGW